MKYNPATQPGPATSQPIAVFSPSPVSNFKRDEARTQENATSGHFILARNRMISRLANYWVLM